jgi:hypothetical protein
MTTAARRRTQRCSGLGLVPVHDPHQFHSTHWSPPGIPRRQSVYGFAPTGQRSWGINVRSELSPR